MPFILSPIWFFGPRMQKAYAVKKSKRNFYYMGHLGNDLGERKLWKLKGHGNLVLYHTQTVANWTKHSLLFGFSPVA